MIILRGYLLNDALGERHFYWTKSQLFDEAIIDWLGTPFEGAPSQDNQ